MGTRKNYRTPEATPHIDLTDRRYWRYRSNLRVLNALLYLDLAREAAERQDFERACRGYRKALESWQSANSDSDGAWQREQDLTNREYASFLLNGHGTA